MSPATRRSDLAPPRLPAGDPLTRAQPQPSVRGAVEDVLVSGQRLLGSRLALLQLDVREQIARAGLDLALAGVGALAGLLALGTLTVAAVLGLSRLLPLDLAALCVGGAQLLLGGGAAALVVARRRRGVVPPPGSAAPDGPAPREASRP